MHSNENTVARESSLGSKATHPISNGVNNLVDAQLALDAQIRDDLVEIEIRRLRVKQNSERRENLRQAALALEVEFKNRAVA